MERDVGPKCFNFKCLFFNLRIEILEHENMFAVGNDPTGRKDM